MSIQSEVKRLARIDALIAEWKGTTDANRDHRDAICRELDLLYPAQRGKWQKHHKPSYAHAIEFGIVKRQKGHNGGGRQSISSDTMCKRLADYRDSLHMRLRHNPELERIAGESMAFGKRMGWHYEQITQHVESVVLSVQVGA